MQAVCKRSRTQFRLYPCQTIGAELFPQWLIAIEAYAILRELITVIGCKVVHAMVPFHLSGDHWGHDQRHSKAGGLVSFEGQTRGVTSRYDEDPCAIVEGPQVIKPSQYSNGGIGDFAPQE